VLARVADAGALFIEGRGCGRRLILAGRAPIRWAAGADHQRADDIEPDRTPPDPRVAVAAFDRRKR
jgi:hypothetical protein